MIFGFSMIFVVFDFLMGLWRAGRCLKSFLDAVRNFLTEYELIFGQKVAYRIQEAF